MGGSSQRKEFAPSGRVLLSREAYMKSKKLIPFVNMDFQAGDVPIHLKNDPTGEGAHK